MMPTELIQVMFEYMKVEAPPHGYRLVKIFQVKLLEIGLDFLFRYHQMVIELLSVLLEMVTTDLFQVMFEYMNSMAAYGHRKVRT